MYHSWIVPRILVYKVMWGLSSTGSSELSSFVALNRRLEPGYRHLHLRRAGGTSKAAVCRFAPRTLPRQRDLLLATRRKQGPVLDFLFQVNLACFVRTFDRCVSVFVFSRYSCVSTFWFPWSACFVLSASASFADRFSLFAFPIFTDHFLLVDQQYCLPLQLSQGLLDGDNFLPPQVTMKYRGSFGGNLSGRAAFRISKFATACRTVCHEFSENILSPAASLRRLLFSSKNLPSEPYSGTLPLEALPNGPPDPCNC